MQIAILIFTLIASSFSTALIVRMIKRLLGFKSMISLLFTPLFAILHVYAIDYIDCMLNESSCRPDALDGVGYVILLILITFGAFFADPVISDLFKKFSSSNES